MQRTAGSENSLHYCTSLEEVKVKTPDISDYLNFEFHDWCWYNNNASLLETKLVKCLGVSHRVGSFMSY